MNTMIELLNSWVAIIVAVSLMPTIGLASFVGLLTFLESWANKKTMKPER